MDKNSKMKVHKGCHCQQCKAAAASDAGKELKVLEERKFRHKHNQILKDEVRKLGTDPDDGSERADYIEITHLRLG